MSDRKKDYVLPLTFPAHLALLVVVALLSVLVTVGITFGVQSFKDHKLSTEVIVAGIGFAGVCVTAYFGYLGVLKHNQARVMAENEMEFQVASLDFSSFMEEWSDVVSELDNLMENTNIDRFLILRAWNGVLSPRWTTAVLQVRQGQQEPISYVHYELDSDYILRLQEISRTGKIRFDVDALPDDVGIKQIYQAEGVSASAWFHIEDRDLPNSESRAVTYCSFAAHEGSISDATFLRCTLLAGRLKGAANSFK